MNRVHMNRSKACTSSVKWLSYTSSWFRWGAKCKKKKKSAPIPFWESGCKTKLLSTLHKRNHCKASHRQDQCNVHGLVRALFVGASTPCTVQVRGVHTFSRNPRSRSEHHCNFLSLALMFITVAAHSARPMQRTERPLIKDRFIVCTRSSRVHAGVPECSKCSILVDPPPGASAWLN